MQTTLERRARWLFPAGTAVPLVSASPSGMRREISGLCQVGISVCSGHAGLLRGRQIIPTQGETAQCCSLSLTLPDPKMFLRGLICRFLSCAGFSGVSHLGATSPCCARAGGCPSEAGTSGCVIAAARRGKVHHGKMPGGLLTAVLWRAQLRKL